ncbi:MAG: D-glycerate dehydrogenase [Chloroflexota bacterium]|nr:D-glycerate dehydrogenase [Chloroflexota bacterium]MDE2893962.1 D-glycerate dehydrogenase [Chloroflexota bacterium]
MAAPYRVFVTRELPGRGFADLRDDPAFNLDVWPGDFPPSRADLLRHVVGVDGLVCLITDSIDAEVLDAAGAQLRVVSQMAVGVDNVDVAACSARGIPVGNTPGVLTDTTADMAWALILASARRVVEAAEYVKDGQWKTWTPTQMAGVDVYGSTLGIIGFGAIGQAIARRAQGFGMRVLCWNRSPRPAEAAAVGAQQCQFDQVLSEADFVCVSIALTDDTRDLIDANAFGLMKPGAILVNTARGPIVDEEALVEALRGGQIGGAGLDVTAVEPLSLDSPLLTMDNVVVLPHIGSASMATRGKMADMAVANLRAGLAGEPLPNSVGG